MSLQIKKLFPKFLNEEKMVVGKSKEIKKQKALIANLEPDHELQRVH